MLKKCFFSIILLTSVFLFSGGIVSGVVLDECGNPITARVIAVAPERSFLVTAYTDWSGRFSLELSEGLYTLEISKGLEYERLSLKVPVREGEERSFEIVLKRLINLSALGWFPGDTHLHTVHSDGKDDPELLALACTANGLSWAVLSDHNTLSGGEKWLSFRDKLLTILGQEVTTRLGHVNAIGVRELVPWDVKRREDLLEIFELIRKQGGVSQINHPFDTKSPLRNFKELDLEAYDLIEIWNGGSPPNIEGFGNLEAKLFWFDLLNRGRKVFASAGSDCHDVHNVYSSLAFAPTPLFMWALRTRIGDPKVLERARENEKLLKEWVRYGLYPGYPRVYVKVNTLTEEEVLKALKEGRSFLTNGPLLLVELNGRGPGETVRLRDNEPALLKVNLFSNVPVSRLRVIQSGNEVASLELKGWEASSWQLSLKPKDGDWVVVEAFGDFPVYAITNPIFLKVE